MICPFLLGPLVAAYVAGGDGDDAATAMRAATMPPSPASCIGARCHLWNALHGGTSGRCNLAPEANVMPDPSAAGE